MAKFRKKPVVIEAVQWNGCWDKTESVSWAAVGIRDGILKYAGGPTPGKLLIATLEGVMTADVGDWIIRGVKGEMYPCKPDIFAATYDPAGDAEQQVPCAICGSTDQYHRRMARGGHTTPRASP